MRASRQTTRCDLSLSLLQMANHQSPTGVPDGTGKIPTETLKIIAQSVARVLYQRELTTDEMHEVLTKVPSETAESKRRTVWTPPELAREWGVSREKILSWIRTGELPAVNVANAGTIRPRFRIDADGIAAFKARRGVCTDSRQSRRRKPSSNEAIEFF